MIPKIIHYCWFGNKPMSILELNCIQTWRKVLPDYEIKLWNENNFDYSKYSFSLGAYNLGKYAFVADVCRLHALYKEGGIYLDTDMLLLKDLNDFIGFDLFFGEEKEGLISAGIIGSIKNNSVLADLLNQYKQMKYDFKSPMDIPSFLTSNLERGRVKVFPKEFFYPLPFAQKGRDYRPFVKPQTYAIHLWNHSWKSEWSHLHDKNFSKALRLFLDRISSNPKSIWKDSFPLDFMKYFMAHKFTWLYDRYKSHSNKKGI
ncbi:glycosyltransferase [Echinicola jeungdonensis]|uniref:Glycosyltransferase n=1 Tax=Echinicola jeungdonensis TaxID=709343 RepID=A0ABV5J572_9BACT|nr:glycosyltransferase [Echinicola jeungdonensis]MDN3667873.1 glycosyltransferase [Echinicola jeungdonensis]